MSDHCGTTTAEGNAVCVPGICSCSSEVQNNETQNNTSKQFIVISSEPNEEENHVEENS